jgi:hypothetical protein
MPVLQQSLTLQISIRERETIQNLGKREDIVQVLNFVKDRIFELKSKGNYIAYCQDVGQLLLQVVGMFDSSHIWTNDLPVLFEVGQIYKHQIETGQPAFVDTYGNVEQFLSSLKDLYQREDLYPEVPLTAVMVAFYIYETYILLEPSSETFDKARMVAEREAQLIVNNLEKIREFNPTHPIKYEDAAICLLTLAKLGRICNRKKESAELRRLAQEIITTHNLVLMELGLAWEDYEQTFSTEILRDIYKRFELARKDLDELQLPHMKVIYGVVSAVLETISVKRQHFLDEAESFSLDIMEPAVSDTPAQLTDLIMSQSSSEQMLHVVRMFRCLILASETADVNSMRKFIRQAASEARANLVEIHSNDSINQMFLWTILLEKILSNNTDSLDKELSEIKSPSSEVLQQFENLANQWRFLSGALFYNYTIVNKIQIDRQDIWNVVLLKFMRSKVEISIRDSVLDSKALVFVEGKTDVAIFEEFAKKTIPSQKIAFIESGDGPIWNISPMLDSQNHSLFPSSVFLMVTLQESFRCHK